MFRASAQMVLIPVTVTDRTGRTIEGLQAEDFRVFDDQKPQRITSFAIEDAPCSVAVVLDISGSMRNILGPALDIARTLFGIANPEDEFLLLTVSSQPEALSEFTADVPGLEHSIEFTEAGGMTALIDTIYLGLNRMRRAHRPRRAMVVISDGMDNYSRYSESELLRVVLEADTQIYTIILDNPSGGTSSGGASFRPGMAVKPWDQAGERRGPDLLDMISEKTGGLHFHVRDTAQAKEAVMKAGRALHTEYLIGYEPADSAAAGKWHRVQVKANLPKVEVHARNGYYSH
jgi:Ca-activated chloride channel homolog